jgi:hypothetical protein
MQIELSKRTYSFVRKMRGSAMLFEDRVTGQLLWLSEAELLDLLRNGTVRSIDPIRGAAPGPDDLRAGRRDIRNRPTE